MRTVLIILLLGVIASLSSAVYLHTSRPRTAFVNLNDVYEHFDLKKELDARYLDTENKRKAVLDSLQVQIDVLGRNVERQGVDRERIRVPLESLEREYLMRKRRLDEDNRVQKEQYVSQIWAQLNQYIGDYGKEHEFTYIYGAEGSGALMYASKDKDITDEMIEYVNKRYGGQ